MSLPEKEKDGSSQSADGKRKGRGQASVAATRIVTQIVAKEIQSILATKGVSMAAVSKEVKRIERERKVSRKKIDKVITLVMSKIEKHGLLTPEFANLLVVELSKKVGTISGVLCGSDLEAGSQDADLGIDGIDSDGTRAPPRVLSKEELLVRNELVLENKRLVGFVIKKFFSVALATGLVRFEDMLQYGMIGLIKAADRYDPAKSKFSTYAPWWIRRTIDLGIKNNECSIRVPINKIDEYRREEKESREAACNAFLNGEEENVCPERSKLDKFRTVSLDGPLSGKDDSMERGELIPSPLPSPEENTIFFQGERKRKDMTNLLESRLSVVEWHVLKRRFGIGDDTPRTLAEIGVELNVTREYVRLIEVRALRLAREIFKEKKRGILQ